MKKISILINSCDAYSDAWNPFFRILERTWPEAKDYDIYINTETIQYKDSFFDIKTLNCLDNSSKIPWGMRLIQALERIDSEYIIFLLEDFFFENKVPNEVVMKCVDFLETDPDIASICMTSPMECSDEEYCKIHYNMNFPNLVIRKQRAYYKYDASPSIWRKSKLIKCTFLSDTPWSWEFFGNQRTWFTKDKFYGLISSAPRIFDYDIVHGGAIHRGKWVGYKMKELQEKYGIDIDMSKRGVVDDWMKEPSCITIPPAYTRLGSIIQNRVKAVFSILYGMFIGRFK